MPYTNINQLIQEVEELKAEYAALVSALNKPGTLPIPPVEGGQENESECDFLLLYLLLNK